MLHALCATASASGVGATGGERGRSEKGARGGRRASSPTAEGHLCETLLLIETRRSSQVHTTDKSFHKIDNKHVLPGAI